MAKKYLTLEEAALELGMLPEELVRMRERGEIRGFADRGTWKFKSEDVEEFGRSRQADSSPEVPLLDDPQGPRTEVIRKGPGSSRLNKTSDSDVRLLLDDALVPGTQDSHPDGGLANLGNSDSDVRLMDDADGIVDTGSDSDVKLITTSPGETLAASPGLSLDAGSDSDVKLIAPGSDSDVRLAKPSGRPAADRNVRLARSGTDDLATLDEKAMRQLTQDKTVDLGEKRRRKGPQGGPDETVALRGGASPSDESSVLLGADSGIALDAGSGTKIGGTAADSGITLQSLADSGISLEKVDSGITLAGPMDSGIALDADSGIALENDSDITLSRKEDSGISLADDSGIRLDEKGVNKTAPMLKMDDEDDEDSTQVEVPTLGDDEEDSNSYKLHDNVPKKNVVLFADEDEDEPSAAPAAKSKKGRPDDSFSLAESGVEFSEAEDFGDDQDLEVADDVLSDEGELDEIDVFEPAEEDFDSTAQSGESHAEISAPVTAMRPAAAVETEWDGLTFAGLAISGVCLILAGVMMYDLVRTEWYFDQNVIVGNGLLDWVGGLFKS